MFGKAPSFPAQSMDNPLVFDQNEIEIEDPRSTFNTTIPSELEPSPAAKASRFRMRTAWIWSRQTQPRLKPQSNTTVYIAFWILTFWYLSANKTPYLSEIGITKMNSCASYEIRFFLSLSTLLGFPNGTVLLNKRATHLLSILFFFSCLLFYILQRSLYEAISAISDHWIRGINVSTPGKFKFNYQNQNLNVMLPFRCLHHCLVLFYICYRPFLRSARISKSWKSKSDTKWRRTLFPQTWASSHQNNPPKQV